MLSKSFRRWKKRLILPPRTINRTSRMTLISLSSKCQIGKGWLKFQKINCKTSINTVIKNSHAWRNVKRKFNKLSWANLAKLKTTQNLRRKKKKGRSQVESPRSRRLNKMSQSKMFKKQYLMNNQKKMIFWPKTWKEQRGWVAHFWVICWWTATTHKRDSAHNEWFRFI